MRSALTPDRWTTLPKATRDELTEWWERQGHGPLTDLVLLARDDAEIEFTRVIRDANGQLQFDPESGSPPTEFLKETDRFTPTEPVPDWEAA